MAYNEDAKYLSLWFGFTLITEDQIPRVQFGDVMIPKIFAEARENRFRVIIIDAPLGLATG